jgi:pSer/pThr/pTyr-binding forkhead associated (FHA) protein
MPKNHAAPARLEVLTPEAQRLLGASVIDVDPTPLRVGRGEFRPAVLMGGLRKKVERMLRAADFDEGESPSAMLELPEKEERRFVSKEHFEIVRGKTGYELVDLGSSLGTVVDGELVGGKRQGGRAKLEDGSVIIVGSHHSGFIFRFRSS